MNFIISRVEITVSDTNRDILQKERATSDRHHDSAACRLELYNLYKAARMGKLLFKSN